MNTDLHTSFKIYIYAGAINLRTLMFFVSIIYNCLSMHAQNGFVCLKLMFFYTKLSTVFNAYSKNKQKIGNTRSQNTDGTELKHGSKHVKKIKELLSLVKAARTCVILLI